MKKPYRKRQSFTFFKTYVSLAIISLVVVFSGSQILFKPKPSLYPLALLAAPQAPTIYLPGVYQAPLLDTSPVLGAETIHPRDIITYINNERMKIGAPPLVENKTLAMAAQKRADVILKYENFSHQDPYEHIQLDTVLPILNYPFTWASENIGMGDDSAKAFVGGFMSSPSHKANLLNPALQETGVAIVTGPYKQYWVNIAVQIFAIPTTKEQFLGYQKKDIEQYKQILADIEAQLALTNDRLQNHVGDEAYYEGWQKILIRQKEIVTLLYNTMLEKQPFVKNLVTLITEYNNNWNLVPKTKS